MYNRYDLPQIMIDHKDKKHEILVGKKIGKLEFEPNGKYHKLMPPDWTWPSTMTASGDTTGEWVSHMLLNTQIHINIDFVD